MVPNHDIDATAACVVSSSEGALRVMTEGDLPALPACISCSRVPHAPVSRDAAVSFGTPLHKSHSWTLGGPRSPVDGPSRRLRSPWQAQQPQQGLAAWRLARTTFDTPNRLMPETSLLSGYFSSGSSLEHAVAKGCKALQAPKENQASLLNKCAACVCSKNNCRRGGGSCVAMGMRLQ